VGATETGTMPCFISRPCSLILTLSILIIVFPSLIFGSESTTETDCFINSIGLLCSVCDVLVGIPFDMVLD